MPCSSPFFHGYLRTTSHFVMSLKPTTVIYSSSSRTPSYLLHFAKQRSFRTLACRPLQWRMFRVAAVGASKRSSELLHRSNESSKWLQFHQSKEFGRFAYDDYSEDESDKETDSAQQLVSLCAISFDTFR
ncbi:DExH-box ATP-dependent RNA helicase DExH3 [Bienertia sinuspersici]